MGEAAEARWPGTARELALVLDRAADAITVQGPDGHLIYANEAAARIMGFDTPAQLLTTPLPEVMQRFELLDERGNPLPLEALPSRRALAGETGPASVVRFRTVAHGQDRWSLVQAIPIIEDGRVQMVVNTFQDVTGLKRSERRLRLLADAGAILGRSAEYEETLKELAHLVVPDLADWCVVDVTDASQSIRRVAVAHVDPAKRELATEIERRYPPDPSEPSGVVEVIRTGQPVVTTEVTPEMLRAAARDDDHFRMLQEAGIASAVILPLIARGQVLGAMTMVGSPGGHRYDASDLPLLGELARRAALAVDNARLLHEATEAVRLRDDFLAMASHDMRTPLAVILANIQLTRRKLSGDPAAAELVRHLESAERTTQKMTGLVGELMDVTILRSGQALPLAREPVDLSAMARAFAEEYGRLSDQHRIEVDAEEAVIGEWDPTRIERVARNLIDNALKYSPSGGLIQISVVAESDDDGRRWARLAVTDEGVGIPADEVDQLFEKFHRGSNTRDLRGTGLGLAGSRAVIEQLGGTVDVASRLGEGSTFTVRLPLDGNTG